MPCVTVQNPESTSQLWMCGYIHFLVCFPFADKWQFCKTWYLKIWVFFLSFPKQLKDFLTELQLEQRLFVVCLVSPVLLIRAKPVS